MPPCNQLQERSQFFQRIISVHLIICLTLPLSAPLTTCRSRQSSVGDKPRYTLPFSQFNGFNVCSVFSESFAYGYIHIPDKDFKQR